MYTSYICLIFTTDPGVGSITFEALVAFVITLAVLFAVNRRSNDWPEAIPLHIGLILLSGWLITHWIDEVINHAKPDITPYSIIYSMFTHFVRICSDVLTTAGIWRAIIRFDFLQPPKDDLLIYVLFLSILWILAGTHIVLLITVTGTFLANMDKNGVGRIARARSVFEVIYMVVQFCAMLLLCFHAYSNVTTRAAGCAYYNEMEYMVHVAIALLLRSFCEVVIVGQLDRDRASIVNTQRARDVMYGLCSIYLVCVIAFAVPEKGKEDLLVAKNRSAVDEINRLINEKIEEVTDGGRNTAPTMFRVLDGIEATLKAQTIPEDAQQEHSMKLNEIARLRKTLGNWEPVYKGGGNTNEQNEMAQLVEMNDRSVQRIKKGDRAG